MNDWRTEYLICEHVEQDEAKGTKHSGFRVCCEECWKQGFLEKEKLLTEKRGELVIGKIPQ